ncbi:MAG: FtsX-like permease family protein [Gammaproteobacteria bacterium AqS3]|nr:FtsX-like permease family protein [Gammaproteobacteria bacterium AqS3]
MKLALRLLISHLRQSTGALFLSLVLVVISAVAVTVLTDRLDRAVRFSSNVLLAADAVVSSRKPLPDEFRSGAEAAGLQSVGMVTFSSVLFGETQAITASVKAVETGYPLRGRVWTSDEPFGLGAPDQDGAPAPGEVWLESRLAAQLGARPGDAVELGETELKFARILVREPDPAQGFGYAPRALINLADLERADVLRPGSRATRRLLLAGAPDAVEAYVGTLQLASGERLWRVGDQQPNLARALNNGKVFLLLSTLLVVLTCAAASGMSARIFAHRQVRAIGLLKAEGMTPARVLGLLLWQISALGAGAWLIGGAVGWGVQTLLGEMAARWVQIELPAASPHLLISGGVALLVLYGFALPPLLKLYRLTPMAVLRPQTDLDTQPAPLQRTLPLLSLLSVFLLVLWYGGQWRMIGIVLVSTLGMGLFCYGAVHGLGRLLRRSGNLTGGWWRLLSANLRRGQQPLQLAVASLVLFTGLLLAAVRFDLLQDWTRAIPDDAPDHFLFNISPHERDAVRDHLVDQGWAHSDFFPLVNARLLEVNGEVLEERTSEGESPRRRARDINLSWAQELPSSNRLLRGAWWDGPPAPEGAVRISLEAEFAGRYDIDVGGVLTLKLAERRIQAYVASIRSVDWNAMQPGFWAILEPGVIDETTGLYLTSFRLGEGGGAALYDFLRTWPALGLISMNAVLQQIRGLIAQLGWAVGAIYLLVLAAAALMLYVIVVSSDAEHRRQVLTLRALGVSSRTLSRIRRIEFALRGLIAGLLAAAFAELTLAGLQLWVINVEIRLHLWLWLAGPLSGALLLPAIGALGAGDVRSGQIAGLLRGARSGKVIWIERLLQRVN